MGLFSGVKNAIGGVFGAVEGDPYDAKEAAKIERKAFEGEDERIVAAMRDLFGRDFNIDEIVQPNIVFGRDSTAAERGSAATSQQFYTGGTATESQQDVTPDAYVDEAALAQPALDAQAKQDALDAEAEDYIYNTFGRRNRGPFSIF